MEIRTNQFQNFFLFLCLLMGFSLQAQPGKFDSNVGGGGGDANDAIVMDFEEGGSGDNPCQIKFNVTLRVANLSSYPQHEVIYNLPLGVPPIHVAYNLGGHTGTFVFSQFKFEKFSKSGVPLFKSSRPIVIDAMPFCIAIDEEEGSMPYTLNLQTTSGNPYPVGSYLGITGIFTCQAFTFPGCFMFMNNNVANSSFSGMQDITCKACRTVDEFPKDRASGTDQQDQLAKLLITPNPFDSELTLALPSSATGSTLDIRILDASGKELYSAQLGAATASHHHINTRQWTKGMYFVQVRDGDQSKTLKVVKTN